MWVGGQISLFITKNFINFLNAFSKENQCIMIVEVVVFGVMWVDEKQVTLIKFTWPNIIILHQ